MRVAARRRRGRLDAPGNATEIAVTVAPRRSGRDKVPATEKKSRARIVHRRRKSAAACAATRPPSSWGASDKTERVEELIDQATRARERSAGRPRNRDPRSRGRSGRAALHACVSAVT